MGYAAHGKGYYEVRPVQPRNRYGIRVYEADKEPYVLWYPSESVRQDALDGLRDNPQATQFDFIGLAAKIDAQ